MSTALDMTAPTAAAAASARPDYGLSQRARTWALQAIPPAALLALWYLVAGFVDDHQLPSPSAVLDAASSMVARGELLSAAQESLLTLLVGTAATALVVVPLACVIALSSVGAALVQPFVRLLSHVPAIALIPLFIVWFGFSENAVYATLVYTAFVPLFYVTITGVQKIPTVYAEGLLPLGASRAHTLRAVYGPGALPGIIVAVRLAMGYGWRAVVAGELIVGHGGLGRLLSRAQVGNDIDQIIATMVVICILFLIIDRLFLYPWEQLISARWQAV